jgi:hypothetical protein
VRCSGLSTDADSGAACASASDDALSNYIEVKRNTGTPTVAQAPLVVTANSVTYVPGTLTVQ